MTHPSVAPRDPRTERTINALRHALIHLLDQKNLEEISVSELTQTAGINRSTFYLHFANITEIIRDLEDELYAKYQAYLSDYARTLFTHGAQDHGRHRAATNDLLTETFRFLDRYQSWMPLFLTKGRRSRLLRMILASGEEIFVRDWLIQGMVIPDAAIRDYYHFVVNGIIGLLEHWVSEGIVLTPEERAARLSLYIATGPTLPVQTPRD